MFNLDFFISEFEDRSRMKLGKSDADATHGKGNVLYDILLKPNTQVALLSSYASYYVLKLEEDTTSSSFELTLYPLHDVENYRYYLNYKDNRNYEVSYTNGSENVSIKSSTITWEQNEITMVGEQMLITATDSTSKLEFAYIPGVSLKGSSEENFTEDGSKVKIEFDYSFKADMPTFTEMLEEVSKAKNKILVALKNGAKYHAVFFVDSFNNDVYVPTLYSENEKRPFNTIYNSDKCEEIKEEYIYPVVNELMYLFTTPQTTIEELCQLLADPNNLPFVIV